MIFIEDLSEIKQFEEEKRVLKLQLERSQKLESLGILAGGIAHDFNNLLHAIMGNVTLATMEVSSEKSVLNYLSEIEKITRSAGDLAHQMLAYSGRGKFFVEPFNLNEFIVEMEDLLALSSKNHAKIEFIRYPLDLIIEGDKSQIQQIILNLVTNASDSNLDDEIIVIRTGLTSLSRNDITSKYHGMKPEEFDDTIKYVTLEVEDRGHGIDEDKIELIFDPFYTTKFTGRGLGLAVVLGVVIAHKGLIHVNTKRGVGTSFTVYLPQSLKQIEETKMSTEEKKQNSGTILVCDDDDAVRRVTKLMLQRIGYQVIDVATGNDAVETFKSNDNIDYVLADLTMPGMDGVELCEALRKLDPEVKVVLSSGYSQAELSKKYSEHGFMAFLQKPYSIKHLQEIFH